MQGLLKPPILHNSLRSRLPSSATDAYILHFPREQKKARNNNNSSRTQQQQKIKKGKEKKQFFFVYT